LSVIASPDAEDQCIGSRFRRQCELRVDRRCLEIERAVDRKPRTILRRQYALAMRICSPAMVTSASARHRKLAIVHGRAHGSTDFAGIDGAGVLIRKTHGRVEGGRAGPPNCARERNVPPPCNAPTIPSGT
jgi:hypothetical protein